MLANLIKLIINGKSMLYCVPVDVIKIILAHLPHRCRQSLLSTCRYMGHLITTVYRRTIKLSDSTFEDVYLINPTENLLSECLTSHIGEIQMTYLILAAIVNGHKCLISSIIKKMFNNNWYPIVYIESDFQNIDKMFLFDSCETEYPKNLCNPFFNYRRYKQIILTSLVRTNRFDLYKFFVQKPIVNKADLFMHLADFYFFLTLEDLALMSYRNEYITLYKLNIKNLRYKNMMIGAECSRLWFAALLGGNLDLYQWLQGCCTWQFSHMFPK